MASALSTQSLLLSLNPNFPRNPLKSASLRTNLNPSAISLSFHLSRRPSRTSIRVAETDPKTINGNEEDKVSVNQTEDSSAQDNLPPMKVLVQAYRKAILEEDEKRASEIEALICIIESEKNNLSLKSEELTTEIVSGKTKFLRIKADLENYRKRIEKDRLSLTSNVQGELIESLLPLVDSFEMAKQQLKPETEKEKKIDASYQGIYKQFVETMRSLRVAVVGTVGKPFDPSIHEAIGREESQNFKEGIVTEEVRRGFVLGDRLLRPATVKVSIGPGPAKAAQANGKASEQIEAASEPVEGTKTASSSS